MVLSTENQWEGNYIFNQISDKVFTLGLFQLTVDFPSCNKLKAHVFDALNYKINNPQMLYTGICSSTFYHSPLFIVVFFMGDSRDTGL